MWPGCSCVGAPRAFSCQVLFKSDFSGCPGQGTLAAGALEARSPLRLVAVRLARRGLGLLGFPAGNLTPVWEGAKAHGLTQAEAS